MNMMSTSVATVILGLLWCLSAATFFNCGNADHPAAVCNEGEKQALLNFKQGLTDPSNRLSSWSATQGEEDCCRWTGVLCDNATGRVIELHLQNPYGILAASWRMSSFGGKLNPALLELKYLNYLDLSRNYFAGTQIPSFLGSMSSLRYLNLYNAFFVGLIPHQLGNLSSLHYLNLAANSGLSADKLNWIGHLYSLEYLDMSGIDLGKAAPDHWLQVMTLLPSLSELHLSSCGLDKVNNIPPLGYVNFTSLQVLDLSTNKFNSEIPDWLFNLSTSLVSLNLRTASLYGHIPGKMSNLCKLNNLNLAYNQLTGQISEGFGNLSLTRILDFSGNQLNGTLPNSIGLLSNLEELELGQNSLEGILSEVNFAKLSKLKKLDISLNSNLTFSVNSDWVPPFQLQYFRVSRCKMGPNFPVWLRKQTFLETLDISSTGISDTVPEWFWKLASHIKWISIADNQIHGDLSNVLLNSTYIFLSSNRFHGQLPSLSPNVQVLKIANNSLSGLISPFLCQEMHRYNNVNLLALSNNMLSGGLSHCWIYWQHLSILNLGSNNLSGEIPNSMGSLVGLWTLHLHNNNLFGNIPSSLRNCTHLGLINLGENEFTGLIPNWMGEMKDLMGLRLRSNKFNGNIPSQMCQLSSLSVIDLANNSLSGNIPTCLNNLSAMATTTSIGLAFFLSGFGLYEENLMLVAKGIESKYDKLRIVRSIDLSSNNLSGSIPKEISNLVEMQFLNLSRNHLTGKVPEEIGGIKMLESLDLSRNHLSREIPESMSNLTFLSYLDLSYNNFSGRIPSGTQIQSFDEAMFNGNAELCGAPLPKNCTKDHVSQDGTPVGEGGDELDEMSWFCIGLGPGFAAGFWGVCGVIFFKRNWRHAYFQFLEDTKDRIYVAVLLKLNRFRKWFKRCNNV